MATDIYTAPATIYSTTPGIGTWKIPCQTTVNTAVGFITFTVTVGGRTLLGDSVVYSKKAGVTSAEYPVIVDCSAADAIVVTIQSSNSADTAVTLNAPTAILQPVNAAQVGGTAQTARDLGASVLLSVGTGAGQVNASGGVVPSDITKVLGTAIPAESVAGRDAAAFGKLLDVATPVFTAASVNQTGDCYSSAQRQQMAREAHGVSGTVWHVAYNAAETMGNDALSWATADLTAGAGVKTDVEAAGAGDLVQIGAGTFALGADFATSPAGVSIAGAGQDLTIITGTLSSHSEISPMIIVNGRLSDMTLTGLAVNGNYQGPVKMLSGSSAARIRVSADTDGFNIYGSAVLDECSATTRYDSLVMTEEGTVRVNGGQYRSTGSSYSGDLLARGIIAAGSGDLFLNGVFASGQNGNGYTYGVDALESKNVWIFNNSTIHASDTNSSVVVAGIHASGSNNIYMFGGSIRTASGDNTDLAVLNAGTGKIVLIGVDFDRTKTSNTGGGQIVDIPAHSLDSNGLTIQEAAAAALAAYNTTGVAKEESVGAIATILSGITSLAKLLRGLYRKDAMDATAKSEVNDGGGTFNEATDSLEAQQEYAVITQADTNELQAELADGGRTDLLIDSIITHLTGIKGVSWSTETLVAIQTAIATRLATTGYTAPDNTNIGVAASKATDAAADAATIKGKLPAGGALMHAAGAAVAKSPATLDWSADVTNKPTIGTSTFDPAAQEVTPTAASKTGYALSAAGLTAVTETVWTALTAGLTTAGSIGKWLLDNMLLRTAWTDVRAAKLDNLDSVSLGTGARTVTITVTDGTDPIQNACVRVTSGATTYVGSTNASGIIVFSLDEATWTVTITASSYTFTPTTLVVAANTAHTYAMTATTLPASNPGLITGYLYTYSHLGVIEAGVVIELQLIGVAGSGYSFDQATRTGTSSSLGLVSFTNLSVGASYKLRRSSTGKWKNITIEADAVSPLALPNIFGTDA